MVVKRAHTISLYYTLIRFDIDLNVITSETRCEATVGDSAVEDRTVADTVVAMCMFFHMNVNRTTSVSMSVISRHQAVRQRRTEGEPNGKEMLCDMICDVQTETLL